MDNRFQVENLTNVLYLKFKLYPMEKQYICSRWQRNFYDISLTLVIFQLTGEYRVGERVIPLYITLDLTFDLKNYSPP